MGGRILDFGFRISEKNSNGERWGAPAPVRRVNGIFSGVRFLGLTEGGCGRVRSGWRDAEESKQGSSQKRTLQASVIR